MTTTDREHRVPAVAKAFSLLELIAETPEGLRMIDATSTLGLAKSTTHSLLTTLEELGYIIRTNKGRFHLSGRMATLAQSAARHNSLPEIVRPVLVDLSSRLGLTVHLAELVENQVLYVDKVEEPGLVRFDTHVGKRADAHLTAVGKALLALLPEQEVAEKMKAGRLRRGTERSPASLKELKSQLARVRADGYAIEDQEEVQGVRCVAAAVRGRDGSGLAAIGCIGLSTQLPDERLDEVGRCLREAADHVEKEVNGRPPLM